MSASIPILDIRTALAKHWELARSSDFIRKVLGTYLTRILLMGVGLLNAVVITRLLGPEGRGIYAVAAMIGALGVQFGTLGLHSANPYFAASKPESLPELTGNSLIVGLGVGCFISCLLGIVLTLHPTLLVLRGATLVVAMMWIPCGITYTLLQSLMLGVQDIKHYNVVDIANRCCPFFIIGLLVLTHTISVPSVLSATVIVMTMSWLWLAYRLRRRLPGMRIAVSIRAFRGSITYAVKAYLAGTFCFLVLRADLFMVQHMLGPEQTGYYSVAATMGDYLAIAAVVIGTVLFPKLSAMQDIRQKLLLTKKAVVGTAILLLASSLVAGLLARPAVNLLFGSAFLPSCGAFILLLPGILFLGIHSVAVQFLNSIGYPKSVVIIWGACALLNIAVNVWAIPRFGIAGASVVSSLCYCLACCLVLVVIYRTAAAIAPTALEQTAR